MLRGRNLLVIVLTSASIGLPATVADSAPDPGSVGRQLDRAQQGLRRSNQRSQLLTSELTALSQRVRGAQARAAFARRQAIAARRAERTSAARLAWLQHRLALTRTRLARLRARLAGARRVLAERLVANYKADQPDILTAVLNADGFEQLLDTTAFLRRVADQDTRIIDAVRAARRDAARQAAQFDVLRQRQRIVYARQARERRQRDALAASADQVRSELVAARDAREQRLRSVRVSQRQLAGEVDDLQAQQARVQRQLVAAQARAAGPPTPTPSTSSAPPPASSGSGWRWPVQGPITSPFCEVRSYESCHPGLDIAAPEGTPIRAPTGGRVVLMQSTATSGGYGNYTCIQHSASVSSCYAHQSAFATSTSASVASGQVIGYVGNTGNSRGAHLHFEVRVDGAVTNPLNYL